MSPAAAARRDNLDLFLKAVAEFQAIDGDVTLPALLAYLTAEDDQGNGLDVATPTEADSVKLLTVHRAKGLEWDSVFLVGVCETRFPSNRSRTLWTSSPSVLPASLRGDAADQPQLAGWDKARAGRLPRRHPRARPASRSSASATSPSPAPRTGSRSRPTSGARGPPRSAPRNYQRVVADLRGRAAVSRSSWLRQARDAGTPTPTQLTDVATPWPVAGSAARRCLRLARRPSWCDGPPGTASTRASTWSRPRGWRSGTPSSIGCSPRPAPTGPSVSTCRCPPACRRPRWPGCATTPTGSRATSPGRCRASRRRRPGSAPASTPGSRPASASSRCSTPTTCPDAAISGIDDEDDLRALIARFEAGPFAERVPHAVEAPFALVLAGQVVRGRIDAVYAEAGRRLAGRRLEDQPAADGRPAPARALPARLGRAARRPAGPGVGAAFHYVRSGETVVPPDLPDRHALERPAASLRRRTRPVRPAFGAFNCVCRNGAPHSGHTSSRGGPRCSDATMLLTVGHASTAPRTRACSCG